MALVHMRHKDSKDGSQPAVTTDDAFESLWKAKGWQLTDDQGVFLTGKTPTAAPAAPIPAGGGS